MKKEEEVRKKTAAQRRVQNRKIQKDISTKTSLEKKDVSNVAKVEATDATAKREISRPATDKETKPSAPKPKKTTSPVKKEGVQTKKSTNTDKTMTNGPQTVKKVTKKATSQNTTKVVKKTKPQTKDVSDTTKVIKTSEELKKIQKDPRPKQKSAQPKPMAKKVVEVKNDTEPSFFDKIKTKWKSFKEKRAKKARYDKIQEGRLQDERPSNERPKASKGVFIASIITSSIVGIGIIGVIACAIIGFNLLEGMPELVLTDLVAEESSVIYDANDEVVAELGEYKRENVGYEEMPNVLVDAFLAIEDSRFFDHFGFDIPRFTKAALENLRSGSFDQGGSTFTRQLIKNTYFQVDAGEDSTIAQRSVQRKAQEIILAIEADAKLDKRDIFASYLNRINFGNNIRGIQKAAQYYFGKDVSELDLSESAFLAGIINSPNSCNPYNELIKYDETNIYVSADIMYLENGTQRRNEVLNMMVYHGYITQEECDLAKAVKLEDQLVGESNVWNDEIPYYQSYIDAVIDEVKEVTGLDPTTNSMKIYTNMDPYMQQLVYDIQNTNEQVNWYRDDLQSAIISMNNQTGAVVAVGGGRNQTGALNWNRATMSKIQPGSTIKPIFEYLLAFEKLGWATTHTITDRPIYLYGSDHLIANASGTYDGDMLMTEAVARSLNTPAIQTLQAVIDQEGEEFCVDFLNSIGFEVDASSFDLQYAIGGNTLQVSPEQLAGAHAILFNGGRYIRPHTIRYVTMADGTTYTADTEGERVVSEAAAYLSAQLEYEVVYGDWYNYTQILKDSYPVYAKTGTTDWGDSGESYGIPVGAAKDSWLVCSTNEYTNAIWIGFDRAQEGAYTTSRDDNINLKGQIGNILLDAGIEHFGYEAKAIERPSDVVEITHVRGLYPYVEPTVGTPVTGLIKKEYAELVPESEIEYEYREATLAGISVEPDGYGDIDVNFNMLGDAGVGMQDLTATSLSGKVTQAYGRLYFPRIRYRTPDDVGFEARLIVDGSVIDSSSTSSTQTTLNYSMSDILNANEVEVCASMNGSNNEFCEVVDISRLNDDSDIDNENDRPNDDRDD